MADTLTPEQIEKLKAFDPNKPLVINVAEVPGLEKGLGRFVFRRSNIKDKLKIGILTNKYKENAELDTLHENIAYILATFDVICTEKPTDFKFEELFDLGPLFHLYDRYTEWLDCFRLKLSVSKEATGASV